MIKIKLSFPFPDWDLIRQTPNYSSIWGDYQFFINDNSIEFDYWFVFHSLNSNKESAICPKDNVILITAETNNVHKYKKYFTDQFFGIITCQPELKHNNIQYSIQGHPWFVGANYNVKTNKYDSFDKSYDQLISSSKIKKSKKISIITSNKLQTEGHRKRYEFCVKLKSYFGDSIDLFGRGVNNFNDKWEVLKDYQYSIAIENDVVPHWITEKVTDCYLAHTFPFYFGTENLNQYFDQKSYQMIDINDFEGSKKIIEDILADENHYENHLPYLIEAKIKYLNQYQLFPLITNYIENIHKNQKTVKTNNLIYNYSKFDILKSYIKRKLKYYKLI